MAEKMSILRKSGEKKSDKITGMKKSQNLETNLHQENSDERVSGRKQIMPQF
jgi:hypothetical protein